MERTLTITLEVEVAGESLTGHATDDTGARRSFSGWLGLVTAIDKLVDGVPPAEPRDDDR